MDFSRMCRLCWRKEEKMYPIFTVQNDGEIARKIRKCLTVNVQWDDPMPKNICKRCNRDLDMFSEFQDTALKIDEANKSYLALKSRIEEMEKQREMQSVAVGTEDLNTYLIPPYKVSSNTAVRSSDTVPKELLQQAPAREMVDPTNSKTTDAVTAEKEDDADIVVLAEHLGTRKRRRIGHASAHQNISHQKEEGITQKNQQSSASSQHHEHHLIDGHLCRRILKTLQSFEDLKTFLPPSVTHKQHEQLPGSAKTDTPLSVVEKPVGTSATVDSEHDGQQMELAKVNTPSDPSRDMETSTQIKPTQNGHGQETVARESPKEGP